MLLKKLTNGVRKRKLILINFAKSQAQDAYATFCFGE